MGVWVLLFPLMVFAGNVDRWRAGVRALVLYEGRVFGSISDEKESGVVSSSLLLE